MFGIVCWGRMTYTATVLLNRRFRWSEFPGVLFASAVYQVGFPLLAGSVAAPLWWLDGIGIILFVLGSALNTGAEIQRKRFKESPENKGRLFTGGLFRLARHINYFGDTLWVAGWAMLTHNLWSAIIPVVLALGFVLFFIPSLSNHLRTKYGPEYERWVADSRAFIPWVY